MNFFYHSGAGQIFFIILALVCLFAIWRGGKDYRLFGLCVLAVFLADRTLLASFDVRKEIVLPLTPDEAAVLTLGGIVDFIALLCVLVFAESGKVSWSIAFCFAVKIAFYDALSAGAINWGTMAAWTELAGYLQLLIIGAGAGYAGRRKLVRRSSAGFAGNLGNVADLQKRDGI